MKHSKTTETLIQSIEKIKSQQQHITDKLTQNIAKNNQYLHNLSPTISKNNLVTQINRQRSIDQLSKQLLHKQKMDEYTDVKLAQIQNQNLKRKQQLQRRLQQINKRNAIRISQLKDLQQNVLKKIHQDIQKNQHRQQHLHRQHSKIRKEQGKVSQSMLVQTKESNRQWKLLQQQKIRIQFMAKLQEQNQSQLIDGKDQIIKQINHNKQIKQKNEKLSKKQDIILGDLKKNKKNKAQNKFRSASKLDSKQVGNQYMEQMRIIQKEQSERLKRQKIMDINVKIIGYNSDIMEKISKNTSNLSQFDRLTSLSKTQEQKKKEVVAEADKVKQNILQIEPLPITMINSNYSIPVDSETQNYLRQIKANLNQLQQMHQKTINPQLPILKDSKNQLSLQRNQS